MKSNYQKLNATSLLSANFSLMNVTRSLIASIGLLVVLLIPYISKAQPVAGDYRSNPTTNLWGAAGNWETYNGSAWVAAGNYPGFAAGAGTVTIRDGHDMVLDVTVTLANAIDNLVIGEGTSGSLISDGTNRTLNISGDLSIEAGGSYDLFRTALNVYGNTVIRGSLVDGANQGAVLFVGSLTVDNGGTFAPTSTSAFTFRGGIVNNGTFNKTGTGAVTFNTNPQTISGLQAASMNGTVTVTGVTVTNNLSDLTLLRANANALTGTGTWEQGTGSVLKVTTSSINIANVDFSSNVNTVDYVRNNTQTIYPTTYHHLSVSTSSTKTMGGNVTVNGNLTVSGTATLASDMYQITGNGTGTFTMAAGTTLRLGNTADATDVLFPTNFTNGNISLSSTSTVHYQNNSTQTVSGVPTYGHLTIATGGTKTLAANTTVGGNLTISAGTFDLGSAATSFSVTGNATITGTLDLGTSVTSVTIGGTAAIAGTLTFNGTSTKTVSITGALSGAGTIDMSGGSLTHTLNLGGTPNAITTFTTAAVASTVNYNRNGDQNVFASVNYRNLQFSTGGIKTLQGATTVNNDLTINTNVTLAPVAQNLTVNGETFMNGLFVDNSATGTTSLQNATFSGASMNGTQTGIVDVNGDLTISTGTSTIGRVQLTIDGTTTIATGSTLDFSSTSVTGAKTFADVVTLNGTGTWSSTLQTTAASLVFQNGIVNNNTSAGSFNAGAATFNTISQTLSGAGPYRFGSNVTLADDITLTNQCTHNDAVTIVGILNGSAAATYENAANRTTYYESATAPMVTGNLLVTASGNTFEYSRNNTQSVRGTTYYDLRITGGAGTKTVVTNDVIVNNDLYIGSGATFSPAALNLTVTGETTVDGTFADANTGTNTFTGLLTINNGGSLNTTSTSPFVFSGGITNDGTFNKTGNSSMTFNSNPQTIGGSQPIVMNGVITVTGIAVTNDNTDVTFTSTGNPALTGTGSWTQGAGTTLKLSAASINISSVDFSASNSTVDYNRAGTQTIYSTTYHNLNTSTSGTKTLGGAITVNGNVSIAAGTLATANNNIDLKGNWNNTGGTFTAGTGTVTFSGTASQSIATNAQNFYRVTFNNTTAGLSAITLGSDMTVTNLCTMTDGIINTGSNTLILTSTTAANLAGYSSACYVNGNLRRSITNNTSTYALPVGSSAYQLAELRNNNMTTTTTIDAKFGALVNHDDNDITACDGALCYQSVAPTGMWTIDANANPGTGSYDIYLYTGSLSGMVDNEFAILKRPTGSLDASAWIAEAAGTINADNGAGRLVAHGYALRMGLTAFSEFGMGREQSGGALPIQLVNFDAKLNRKGFVDITWTTATEINNDYFTIERSMNGVNFEALAEVDGAGNSTKTTSYNTIDNNPIKGVGYYRLKQTDYDGTSTYSRIVSVNGVNSAVSFDWTAAPNPVATGGTVSLFSALPSDENYFLEVFEAGTGKKIHDEQFSEAESQFNVGEQFKPGIYIVRIKSNTQLQTIRLMVN